MLVVVRGMIPAVALPNEGDTQRINLDALFCVTLVEGAFFGCLSFLALYPTVRPKQRIAWQQPQWFRKTSIPYAWPWFQPSIGSVNSFHLALKAFV